MRSILSCLAVFLFVLTPVQATDLDKEKRWAEQIADALLDGEAVYLDDGRAPFLAIETESMQDRGTKAVVIMHGTGVHPDWPTVVQPLRVGLAESGWHTLSIQMPVLDNEAGHAAYAAIYDWVPGRIDTAVRHLRDQGFERVVLVAHSQGSTMAVYHLSKQAGAVEGFVAVGMSGGIAGGPMDTLAQLPRVGIPVLDLYGSEDLAEVLNSAALRARSASGNADYTQQQVSGADHFFDGEEAQLMQVVGDWLDRRF